MRRAVALIATAATVAGLAALAIPAMATTRTITVGDNFFVRRGAIPTVAVQHGTLVKWVWRGSNPHNVTVTRGPKRFHSTTQSSSSFVPPRRIRPIPRGLYTIVCTIHPGMGMKLRVK